MDFRQEMIKTIETMVTRQLDKYKVDRTYKSVVKGINKKGYVILDRTGSERTVKCCIPGVELRVGQSVWVKEPMSNIRDLHIVGVIEK